MNVISQTTETLPLLTFFHRETMWTTVRFRP